MIDQSKLSEFWNNDVPGEFKHWMSTDFINKVNKYRADIKGHLIDKVDFKDIKTAIDWGCGGGLGSVLLSEHCDVISLDIADSSLSNCEKYMIHNGKKLKAMYKLTDINNLDIN